VVAIGYEVGKGCQGALVGRIGELGYDGAGFVGEGLGAFADAFESTVAFDQAADLGERSAVIIAVLEYIVNQAFFLRLGVFERVN
jgi:hypothetical protein